MRLVFFILVFTSFIAEAQDKLFFKTGDIKHGVLLNLATDFVLFKYSDTSLTTYRIPKSELVMIEKYDGKVFVIGSKPQADTSRKPVLAKQNSLGTLPLSFFLGRLTFIYERLNKEGTIGYCPVAILSYNPVGILYTARKDSNNRIIHHKQGVSFIGGADVNFYIGKNNKRKFFIGPRARYGIDMFIGSIEAYSLQTQIGWRFGDQSKFSSQHLSFGFGFVRILSSFAGPRINPKQSHAWASITYRIGVNW